MTPSHDVLVARALLPELLRRPASAVRLPPDRWDLLIRQARQAGVLARLCFQLDDLGLLTELPERPRCHLAAARALALKHARDVRWEVACLGRALADCDLAVTLLKGAAYLLADLPPARGRIFSDIDILVPRHRIDEVERALDRAGWAPAVKDSYDQRYYRRWTHQIPPLQHLRRRSVLDVHHTIVPPTARTPVAAADLAFDSLPLGQDRRLRVLAPADMVLHSAVHLVNEGEFDRGLRDLLDLCDLLSHFGGRQGFWQSLDQRAEALGLTRPLYLTLRYLDRLLAVPPPAAFGEAVLRWQPSALSRTVLDALFDRALLPNHDSCNDYLTGTARWLLYVRAHRLRMPLHLLLPHLARKSFRRTTAQENDGRRRRAQIAQLLRAARDPSDDGTPVQAYRTRD
jgi:hypothetical protein